MAEPLAELLKSRSGLDSSAPAVIAGTRHHRAAAEPHGARCGRLRARPSCSSSRWPPLRAKSVAVVQVSRLQPLPTLLQAAVRDRAVLARRASS